jgi:hypothetical protein
MVLFPDPDGPTIAVVTPDLISKSTFSKTFLIFSAARGYLKVTPLNLIAWLTVKSYKHFPKSPISGRLSMTSNIDLATTFPLTKA